MKRKLIIVLRWIAVIPAFVLGAYVARWLTTYAMTFVGFGGMVADLDSTSGFAGHYILGPLYLLWYWSSTSSSSIASAALMAPDYRKMVRIAGAVWCVLVVIAGGWAIYSLPKGSHFDTESVIRVGVQWTGYIIGIVGTFQIDFSKLGNPEYEATTH